MRITPDKRKISKQKRTGFVELLLENNWGYIYKNNAYFSKIVPERTRKVDGIIFSYETMNNNNNNFSLTFGFYNENKSIPYKKFKEVSLNLAEGRNNIKYYFDNHFWIKEGKPIWIGIYSDRNLYMRGMINIQKTAYLIQNNQVSIVNWLGLEINNQNSLPSLFPENNFKLNNDIPSIQLFSDVTKDYLIYQFNTNINYYTFFGSNYIWGVFDSRIHKIDPYYLYWIKRSVNYSPIDAICIDETETFLYLSRGNYYQKIYTSNFNSANYIDVSYPSAFLLTDGNNGFLYGADNRAGGPVRKIKISPFENNASISLDSSETPMLGIKTGQYLMVYCKNNKMVKIDLNNFQKIGTTNLNYYLNSIRPYDNNLWAVSQNGFLVFINVNTMEMNTYMLPIYETFIGVSHHAKDFVINGNRVYILYTNGYLLIAEFPSLKILYVLKPFVDEYGQNIYKINNNIYYYGTFGIIRFIIKEV